MSSDETWSSDLPVPPSDRSKPYDPREDGWTPKPLSEVVEAGKAVLVALDNYRRALRECETPFNMNMSESSASHAQQSLTEDVEALAKAQRVVEEDAPLVVNFRGEGVWYSIEWGPTLSPKQVVTFAAEAASNDSEPSISYREYLAAKNPVPYLIQKDRRAMVRFSDFATMREADEAEKAAHEQLVQDILADIESIECASCDAPAGSPCMTRSGYVAAESHVPRTRASKMVRQYPKEASLANRREAVTWLPRQSPSRPKKSGRTRVQETVAGLADSLADLQR